MIHTVSSPATRKVFALALHLQDALAEALECEEDRALLPFLQGSAFNVQMLLGGLTAGLDDADEERARAAVTVTDCA